MYENIDKSPINGSKYAKRVGFEGTGQGIWRWELSRKPASHDSVADSTGDPLETILPTRLDQPKLEPKGIL